MKKVTKDDMADWQTSDLVASNLCQSYMNTRDCDNQENTGRDQRQNSSIEGEKRAIVK